MTRVCGIALFFCFVFASEYVSGSLIRSKDLPIQDVNTKDVPVEKEIEDGFKVIPIEVAPEKNEEKCAPIGTFVSKIKVFPVVYDRFMTDHNYEVPD